MTVSLFEGMEEKELRVARQLETEGIVLAQNSRKLLPLSQNKQVAVFGYGQLAPTRGGNGSGANNGAYTSTFVDGMEKLGIHAYPELLEFYKSKVRDFNDIDHGWNKESEYPGEWGEVIYSGTTWSMAAGLNTPEVKLDDGEVKEDGMVARARAYTDTAILFVTRTTGAEEMDRIKQNGDWYMDPSAKMLLRQVADKFEKVVVIVSTNGAIDMSWVREYAFDTVMISYAAGSQNGYALADLVFGVENPCGKLADTITETYEEHPTKDTFGYVNYTDLGLTGLANNTRFSDNDPISAYLEGIYVGYRYFDTFGKEVLYPFGSGLSYSDFEFNEISIALDCASKAINVQATIKNNTKDIAIPAGKEVMEVYLSAPGVNLEQPYQKLLDFQKTRKLKRGEQQTISILIPLKNCASFSEEKAAYVLEPGTYYIRVGSSSRNTHVAGAFKIDAEILVEQLENQLEMSTDAAKLFQKKGLSNLNATPITYEGERAELENAAQNAIQVTVENVETKNFIPEAKKYFFQKHKEDMPVYRWNEVQNNKITMEQFVSQLTEDEILMMVTGNIWHGTDTAIYKDDPDISMQFSTKNTGITGCGVTRSIERLGIPSIVFADGSAGIGYIVDGKQNVGWSRAAAIACVWNKELLHEYAVLVGEEMIHINCDVWLAPSINLHRNPLNGRSNEYYSEDPILSGTLAGVVAKGVAESGVTVCLKHFAANDQEYYRRGHYNKSTEENGSSKDALNILSSERALREITLKPFEMAIKTGAIKAVMSAFNKINGQYCASSKDLLTNILRVEWGFDGFVVTDWGEADAIAHAGDMMISGLSLIMRGDHQMYHFSDQIQERLSDETLHFYDLQCNSLYLLKTVNDSALSSMDNKHCYRKELTILSNKLPEARSNIDYSRSKQNPLVAAGGNGSCHTFSVAANSPDQLPEGMKLTPAGYLIGKPVAGHERSYNICFEVSDNMGNRATKLLPLTVKGELEIQPKALPMVILNVPYSKQLNAVDGEGNVVDAIFEVADKLPAGLNLSADGILSGVCKHMEESSLHIHIKATSKAGNKTGTASYTLPVIKSEAAITLNALETAQVSLPYHQALTASGGYGAYRWSVEGLPAGFFLDHNQISYGYIRNGEACLLSVPDSICGIYDISLTVTDELATSQTRSFVLKVGNPNAEVFSVTTGSLPDGRIGTQYRSVQLSTRNAIGKVTFALALESDELPLGMTLKEDGLLSGTPAYTSSGEYKLVVKAQDEGGQSHLMTYTLYIAGGLNIVPAPNMVFCVREGRRFGKQFTATGGIMVEKKYELHETSDSIPAGLTFSSNQTMMTLAGTPAPGTAGTYRLVFVMDDQSFSGNPVTSIVPYTLMIEP